MSTDQLILSILDDVEPLMAAAIDEIGGMPSSGSTLDQAYLLDGREIVVDFLGHGEAGLAFDHLLYMIVEPPLKINDATRDRLAQAGRALRLSPATWERATSAS